MRIGVLLERLNVHSPSAVFADVLKCLDRSRFEVQRMMMVKYSRPMGTLSHIFETGGGLSRGYII